MTIPWFVLIILMAASWLIIHRKYAPILRAKNARIAELREQIRRDTQG